LTRLESLPALFIRLFLADNTPVLAFVDSGLAQAYTTTDAIMFAGFLALRLGSSESSVVPH